MRYRQMASGGVGDFMPDPFVITTTGDNCVGGVNSAGGATASAILTWPAANQAIFVPFYLRSAHTYQAVLWMNGNTVSGNVDIGIYGATGTKLASLGSTAMGLANTAIVTALASPLSLLADTLYFLAMAVDNNTATPIQYQHTNVTLRASGVRERNTSFTLPADASSWVGTTSGNIPWIGLSELSTI